MGPSIGEQRPSPKIVTFSLRGSSSVRKVYVSGLGRRQAEFEERNVSPASFEAEGWLRMGT